MGFVGGLAAGRFVGLSFDHRFHGGGFQRRSVAYFIEAEKTFEFAEQALALGHIHLGGVIGLGRCFGHFGGAARGDGGVRFGPVRRSVGVAGMAANFGWNGFVRRAAGRRRVFLHGRGSRLFRAQTPWHRVIGRIGKQRDVMFAAALAIVRGFAARGGAGRFRPR